jgi:hypothetical protein
MGWINHEATAAPEWDTATVRRLARHLGYQLLWPSDSPLPLPELVRAADVDAVLVPSPHHLSALTLNTLMGMVDVESACPRLTFNRWTALRPGKPE